MEEGLLSLPLLLLDWLASPVGAGDGVAEVRMGEVRELDIAESGLSPP